MVREQIEAKLKAAFEPTHLDVVDESYRHNVPVGSESHFKVVLVSDRFIGERLLTRHRSIYGVLSEELTDGVHALALHLGLRLKLTVISGTFPLIWGITTDEFWSGLRAVSVLAFDDHTGDDQ